MVSIAYIKASCGKLILYSSFVFKVDGRETWCLTSTETIRLIRDGINVDRAVWLLVVFTVIFRLVGVSVGAV